MWIRTAWYGNFKKTSEDLNVTYGNGRIEGKTAIQEKSRDFNG